MWTFTENGHLLLDNINNGKVQNISSSHTMGFIKVTLNDGRDVTLELKMFQSSTHDNFEKMCRTSRTAFLQWAKTQGLCVQDIGRVNGQNSGCLQQTSSDDASQVRSQSNQINENEPKQIEYRELDMKLLGRNVLVPVSNLIEPPFQRKVRELDPDHVKNLEKQLLETPQLFSVLIGNVCSENNVNIDKIQEDGFPFVEVLGGNHTRQALQNLANKEGVVRKVCVDLYKNLTPSEAIFLGLKHNSIHECSRQTSFVELVQLFRKLLQECRKNEKLPKKCSSMWRDQVASIMCVNKQKLKNSFKTHLHCASLSDELWAGIEEFFQAWKDRKILKQPKGDLKQTHLISWTKCDENVKNELLHDVIRGDISFGRFKDRCSIRKKTTKDAEKQQTKKRQHIEDEDLNADEDNENEHQEMLNTDDEPSVRPGARLTSDDLDPKDDYKQALGNVRTKLMIEENRNEELEAENAQLKLELEQTKKQSKTWEEKCQTIKKTNEELQGKIVELEDALKHAQAAAARARKAREMKTVDDLAEKEGFQGRKRKIGPNEEEERENMIEDRRRKLITNQDVEKENMIEVNCGMVQYGGNIYFGKFETETEFVFCKSPVINIDYNEKSITISSKEKTKQLNTRDCQRVKKEEVALKFKAKLSSKGKIDIALRDEYLRRVVKGHLEW